MKCADCGAENPDDAQRCCHCGQSFPLTDHDPDPPTISPFVRMLLLVCMIIVAICVMVPPSYDGSGRSMVARVKGDQRTLSVALETHAMDHNAYLPSSLDRAQNAFGSGLRDEKNVLQKIPTFRVSPGGQFATLTTPFAYVSSYFVDPFSPVKGATFAYWNPDDLPTTHGTGYILWSPGPDGDYDITIDNVAYVYTPHLEVPNVEMIALTYDPSNGTESNGDVYRYKQ